MYEGHWFGYGGGFMWLFFVLLIVLLFWVMRAASSGTNDAPPTTRKTPLEVLQERYARGEIDKAEFEEKRRDLAD